jgi:L-iditol 2-dehydrogenase
MKAAVLHGKNDIRYEEIDNPILEPNTVKVQVMVTGVCGSDVPRVLEGKAHSFPIVLGHEFSGIVSELGPGTTGLSIGDHVAGVPLIPCFHCEDCKRGDFALCKNYSFIGSRRNGSFSEYIVVPQTNVFKIDSKISFSDAALFEPSTVALHGLLMLNINKGASVAIIGGGTIGYFAVQWAKVLGAEVVTIISRSQNKLNLCLKAGADFAIGASDDDFIALAKEKNKGNGYDFVVETAGATEAMKNAFELVGNKGQVCFIGTPTKDLIFQPKQWELMNRKEFTLTGSWMSYSNPFPGHEWEMTASHFSDGRIWADSAIIYKTFPLSQADEAFKLFEDRNGVQGKIMLISSD